MKIEYEVKFYPVDKVDIKKRLENAGATHVQAERKMTLYVYNQRLNPQIDGHYIRVRDEGDRVRLSVKIHAREGDKLSDQKELDVIVSDFQATANILERSGLKRSGYQEKLRETWLLKGTEVVVDTWPGLEPLVEIEGDSEANVREVAELLGFDWAKKIITSVVEVYMHKYNLTVEETLKLLEHATLSENPFARMSS